MEIRSSILPYPPSPESLRRDSGVPRVPVNGGGAGSESVTQVPAERVLQGEVLRAASDRRIGDALAQARLQAQADHNPQAPGSPPPRGSAQGAAAQYRNTEALGGEGGTPPGSRLDTYA